MDDREILAVFVPFLLGGILIMPGVIADRIVGAFWRERKASIEPDQPLYHCCKR